MRRTSVLLADDDERFRAVVRSVLEDDDYDVVAEAATADDTLELARQHHPDVIVLDLVMPGSDGLNTAYDLLEEEPERPVVVMSTLFDPSLELEAVRMGALYLEKVEGIEALEHVIEGAVDISHRP